MAAANYSRLAAAQCGKACLSERLTQKLGEATGGFAIYAYVIMPDHLHLITNFARSSSETLRFINGIISRRVIDWLKEQGYQNSLKKLEKENKFGNYHYSLWDHHPNVRLLMTENMLMQRVHYTHQNPVRATLVNRAEEYYWSSVRYWNRAVCESEPLAMNLDNMRWRNR